MAIIRVLSEETIDKIAAGEVVERPSSVVKELVENAIDAGASSITIEIKDGGITFLRVTDNGIGMEKDQIPTAFLRHATSKITKIEDLMEIESLGFRGEALSSISAVSQVELISKTKENLTGTLYRVEGSREISLEEVGAPNGTTFIVRNLFYNTPARRKFLKSAVTEGSYVADLIEHLALSHPQISFQLQMNGKGKIQTSGKNDLKEVIYRIYGRDSVTHLLPVYAKTDEIEITGFAAKPEMVRSNRNYELFFVNGRYVKSSLLSKAMEEAYRPFLMQHKFPFVILHFHIMTDKIDVNVHPTKMEVRFSDQELIYETALNTILRCLQENERIPVVDVPEPVISEQTVLKAAMPYVKETFSYQAPEPFEKTRVIKNEAIYEETRKELKQMELHDLISEKILSENARREYHIIGQVFETYWMIQYKDQLLFMDQHAAHEKVLYEKLVKQTQNAEIISQQCNPAVIISLSNREEEVLKEYLESFTELGFEIEHFGGMEYALRAVPMELSSICSQDVFREMIDDLSEEGLKKETNEIMKNRLATMACKAAVKGNQRLSFREAEELISELMTLQNPYNCPHGRPTIITMTKQDMEKKFKRIVN